MPLPRCRAASFGNAFRVDEVLATFVAVSDLVSQRIQSPTHDIDAEAPERREEHPAARELFVRKAQKGRVQGEVEDPRASLARDDSDLANQETGVSQPSGPFVCIVEVPMHEDLVEHRPIGTRETWESNALKQPRHGPKTRPIRRWYNRDEASTRRECCGDVGKGKLELGHMFKAAVRDAPAKKPKGRLVAVILPHTSVEYEAVAWARPISLGLTSIPQIFLPGYASSAKTPSPHPTSRIGSSSSKARTARRRRHSRIAKALGA